MVVESLISYWLLINISFSYGNVTSLPVCWNPEASCSSEFLISKTRVAALSTTVGLSSLASPSMATL